MKLFTRTLSLLAIASLTLFFANCGSDGGETNPMKGQLGKLSQTWNIVSAAYGNPAVDRTADFTGFTLTMSGSFDSDNPEGPYDYDVANGQPVLSPWPQAPDGSGGTWEFASTPVGDSGLILRNDGIGMEYTISSGQLTLTFNFSGPGYPATKAAQVEGDWTFVFN